MPIKNTYRGIPRQDLATYDWYDLATGTGYKDFYGMDIVEGASSTIHVLSTQIFYAITGFKAFSVAGEVNLDLELEIPLTIDGVVIVNVPFSSAANLGNITLTFKIYRVDSALAEHQLGSTVTIAHTGFNNEQRINSVKFEVPVTRLQRGEKFRLSISNPATGGQTVFWYMDPKDRDVRAITTKFISSILKLSLPIKL